MRLLPFAAALVALAVPAAAKDAPPPKLVVVISVDQFSADLYDQYRGDFTGGLARLGGGVVFRNAYQSHAATETCPGHSTITTGDRPTRTGIIANDWYNFAAARADKNVYCVEDESVPGSSSSNYTVSDVHLRVPTLGDRMKARDPETRIYAISGKDRSAVTMGGHAIRQGWWWTTGKYETFAGRAVPPLVASFNTALAGQIAQAQPPLDPPAFCTTRDKAVDVGNGKTVGTGRFARAAGDVRAFQASPESDGATLALAAQMIAGGKLGQGKATDLVIIGASATDRVGHTYGPGGLEMCLQLASLDRDLAGFFDVLDRLKLDYAVVLTADHGSGDIPERLRLNGVAAAQRIDPALTAVAMGKALAAKLGLTGQLLYGAPNGDLWVDAALSPTERQRVIAAAIAAYRAHPQVEAVFTAAEIAATPLATTPPDRWSLIERARASFDPERSGAFVVALKRDVSTIADPTGRSVSSHGSFWDYDRRVPAIFWRRGITPGQPDRAIETVDIAPTLAAWIGLPLAPGAVDGKCLPEAASCR